jgi:lysozyme family protein
MESNFARALKLVLVHEGGWSDHPLDKGGATMKGVTLTTFRRYLNPKGTKADLRKITDDQIAEVYRRHYWYAVNADKLPDGVDYAVFDIAVNSGPSRAAKLLQAAVKVRQDGKIGPQTIDATRRMMAATVINEVCDRRMDFLRKLKTWPTFGKGWTRRVSQVRIDALAMVSGRPVLPSQPPVQTPPPVSGPVTPTKTESAPVAKLGWIAAIAGAGLAAWGWAANLPCDWLGVWCG